MSGATEQNGQDAGPDLHRVESLDDLATQAEAIAAPADAPGVALVPAGPDTTEKDVLSALKAAQKIARRGVWWLKPEEFEELWGDQTIRDIAEAAAEVMRHHGLTSGQVFAKYSAHIALGMATIPPAWVTVMAYRQAKKQGAASGQQQPA